MTDPNLPPIRFTEDMTPGVPPGQWAPQPHPQPQPEPVPALPEVRPGEQHPDAAARAAEQRAWEAAMTQRGHSPAPAADTTHPEEYAAARTEDQPKWLELAGERYKAVAKIPVGYVLDIAEAQAALANKDAADYTDAERSVAMGVFLTMLDAVILDEEMPRLRARLRSKTAPVDFDDLSPAISRLWGEYSGVGKGTAG